MKKAPPPSSKTRTGKQNKAMNKEKAPPPSSKTRPGKQNKVPWVLLTPSKDVLSLVALSIFFISFVRIHLKAFRVAAMESGVEPVLDTSVVESVLDTSKHPILADTQYYIIPTGPGLEKYKGLTSRFKDSSYFVGTTAKTNGTPVTFSSLNYQQDCLSMRIQFDANKKWWVSYTRMRSSVKVRNQDGDLFTVKKDDDHYQIYATNYPLGIDNKYGRVVVFQANDTLLQVIFKKVEG